MDINPIKKIQVLLTNKQKPDSKSEITFCQNREETLIMELDKMSMMNNLEKMPDQQELHLEDLKLPQDLKKLTFPQCRRIAKEIRSLMVRVISKNGGHLASNLGAVELTMALHRVFYIPKYIYHLLKQYFE